ncbi:hypothetical protein DMUE_3667 [Dictyocoela muelleri]|nr:hypothetical protein DMUE_3667 [Dictyocoela muelleri]
MVQVDDTVIAHGNLSCCPRGLLDGHPGITWLVEMIEVNTKDFYYMIVPDKTQATFTRLFNIYIEKESIIITYGHASYPIAVQNIQYSHRIVNHSKGFVNIEGFHTNDIENLWYLFKYEIKKSRGVLKRALNNFW